MNDAKEEATVEIERLRPKLLGVAYRMLGSVADAEDAVQDAFLRYQRATDVASPEAWLVKTTTRLCIDRLRRAKRREEYHGPWLPEPVAESWDGAAHDRVELAESLSMAFLVLLETLSPAERAAYLLREVFNYDFDQIAALLDKTPVNVRQIASRAKKRLEQHEKRFVAPAERANDLAERFYHACRSGDVTAIEALLSQDAVAYSDGGGKVHAAPHPIVGRHRVANLMEVGFRKRMQYPGGRLTFTAVNGRPGVVFSVGGTPLHIFSFDEEDGLVTKVYIVMNPDKLARWPSDAL